MPHLGHVIGKPKGKSHIPLHCQVKLEGNGVILQAKGGDGMRRCHMCRRIVLVSLRLTYKRRLSPDSAQAPALRCPQTWPTLQQLQLQATSTTGLLPAPQPPRLP